LDEMCLELLLTIYIIKTIANILQSIVQHLQNCLDIWAEMI